MTNIMPRLTKEISRQYIMHFSISTRLGFSIFLKGASHPSRLSVRHTCHISRAVGRYFEGTVM